MPLRDDATFYALPGLHEQIENYRYLKINVGGMEFAILGSVLVSLSGTLK